MTLGKCNFKLENYSERDHPIGVTTEIIIKLPSLREAFLHLDQNETRAF